MIIQQPHEDPLKRALTAAELRAALHYDPLTGVFIRRHRSDRPKRWNTRYGGKIAGHLIADGRRLISLHFEGKDRRYRAAVLAWLCMTGAWPTFEVDHRDYDNSNDKWDNLRPATHAQNAHNAPVRKNNTTGFKGVTKHEDVFMARIRVPGRRLYLGRFTTAEAAHAAYCEAAARLHGEFARTA